MCTWPEELELVKAKQNAVNIGKDPLENEPAFLDLFRAACAQPRPRLHPELSFQISENLHHYLDHTSKTFQALTPPAHRSRWGGLVLDHAKAFPFVMNALDAITALHRAHLSPRDAHRHIETACSSRAASIKDFRAAVSNITPVNASGALTFAMIQVFLCLEFPIALKTSRSPDILDSAYELLVAIRGFFHLQPMTWPHLSDQNLRNWILSPLRVPLETTQNPGILPHISYLYGILQQMDLPPDERETCHVVVAQLWKFFMEVSIEPRDWIVLFTWPFLLPESFLLLLRRRRPFALVVMAHWFVFVFGGSQHWLLHAWAGSILAGVTRAVGPEWRPVLRRLENVNGETIQ